MVLVQASHEAAVSISSSVASSEGLIGLKEPLSRWLTHMDAGLRRDAPSPLPESTGHTDQS